MWSVQKRVLLMAFLVLALIVQAALVYSDDTGHEVILSDLAIEGRKVWHKNNCQTCHQFYGFGGFLGPDLTNAVRRGLNRERVEEVLTKGSKQMPVFKLSVEQRDAVFQYLVEMDKTGTGQLLLSGLRPEECRAALDQAIAAAKPKLSENVLRGKERMDAQCFSCHVPFMTNTLGAMQPPDLSTVFERLSPDQVRSTIRTGRIEKGMPPFTAAALDEPSLDEIVAFLTWLNHNRKSIAPAQGERKSLPWFTYE